MRKGGFVALVLVAACAHRGPSDAPRRGDRIPGPPEPWHCTAYVARATDWQRIDVQGHGATPDEAYADAWVAACKALPRSDPPTPCEAEAPYPGWTWTREDLDGVVTLHLLPEPPPFQGVAESTVSQDDACVQAYVRACEAAGANPGCQTDEAFVDQGVAAIADEAAPAPEE
jgi:hypothetical protein